MPRGAIRGAVNISRTVGIEDAHIKIGGDLNSDGLNVEVTSTTDAEDKVAGDGPARAVAGTRAQVAVLNSTISVGENANKVSASETGAVNASATTTSGDARAIAFNHGPTGGFLDSPTGYRPDSVATDSLGGGSQRLRPDIRVGRSADISATVDNSATAGATSVGGSASAFADTGRVAGFRNIGIKVGQGGRLTSGVVGSMEATATSVDATSADGRRSEAGVDARAGGRGSSLVGIQLDRSAFRPSGSVAAEGGDGQPPSAEGSGSGGSGGESGGSDLGGSKDLQAIGFGRNADITADVVGQIKAVSDAVSGPASAAARADLIAGIAIGGRSGGEGGEGDDGPAPDGPLPDPGSADPASLTYPHLDHSPIRITIGENGTVAAYGDIGTSTLTDGANASATTVNGPAEASVAIDTIGGLIDRAVIDRHDGHHGLMDAPAQDATAADPQPSEADQGSGGDHHESEPGSVLRIGQIGKVVAGAYGASTAEAKSVSAAADSGASVAADGQSPDHSYGSDGVTARVDHDNVVAIALDKIHIGEGGSLQAEAASTQDATADVVSAGVDPSARVAEDDRVAGVLDTAISVGKTLTVLGNGTPDVSASLIGTALATAVSAEADGFRHAAEGSRAEAGGGSEVVGIRGGRLDVGEAIVNGAATPPFPAFKVAADSDLQAVSTATSGDSRADAGSERSSVAGLKSTRIAVGNDGGVNSKATGSVISDALTTSGDASARSTQTARGLEDSRIAIGRSGDVSAAADLSGSSAKAETTSGRADALLRLRAEGIDQDSRTIRIGEEGSVTGAARAIGDASASAVTVPETSEFKTHAPGSVQAVSDLEANGIHLASDSRIAIGVKGSVAGSAVLAKDPVAPGGALQVTADAISGPAEATGRFSGAGILGSREDRIGAMADKGFERGSSVKAGPEGGSIIGSAVGRADVAANTVDTSEPRGAGALASTDAQLFGISRTDLQAGLKDPATGQPRNSILATAYGRYSTTSTAVSGDATARGDVSVGGLIGNRFGPPSTAKLSGDLVAKATLVNEVVASTVSGAASAIAHGDAVGISGYDIHILGSGSLSAVVNSTTSTSANSVTV